MSQNWTNHRPVGIRNDRCRASPDYPESASSPSDFKLKLYPAARSLLDRGAGVLELLLWRASPRAARFARWGGIG